MDPQGFLSQVQIQQSQEISESEEQDQILDYNFIAFLSEEVIISDTDLMKILKYMINNERIEKD